MNDKQVATVEKIADVLAENLQRYFDRSFTLEVSEKDGNIKVVCTSKDSGNEVMTVTDLAEYLQVKRSTVRRLCEARAQHSSRNPLPFHKINGKMIRFFRTEIDAWKAREPRGAIRPLKGKKKR